MHSLSQTKAQDFVIPLFEGPQESQEPAHTWGLRMRGGVEIKELLLLVPLPRGSG